MLTIQVLTLNNAGTIERCLDSLLPVGGRVVVGDMGSSDGTDAIASGMGAEVVSVRFGGDYSALRNSLIAEGSNMYVEPWESIARGAEHIASLRGSHAFYVLESGVVSKQVRLWDSGRFENPVFEAVAGASPEVTPGVVVLSEGRPDRRKEATDVCRKWVEERPTMPDSHYYLACSLLAEGRAREFSVAAKTYLSMSPPEGDSVVLMNYYLARVGFAIGEYREAYRRAAGCLVARPSYAEFWCLLADMLCARGEYKKATHMYKNALVAGRMRPSDDMFPVEVAKYNSYPKEMEEKCNKAMGEGLFMGGDKSR